MSMGTSGGGVQGQQQRGGKVSLSGQGDGINTAHGGRRGRKSEMGDNRKMLLGGKHPKLQAKQYMSTHLEDIISSSHMGF